MPSEISSEDSEKGSISSQRSSLKALACDEDWSSASESSSDGWDLKLQSSGTKSILVLTSPQSVIFLRSNQKAKRICLDAG
jgi:hypothetical protein